MKKELLITSILLILSGSALADRCIGSVVNGKCYGTMVPGNNSGGYRGSSGSRYQYDLNNQYDRNNYSVDIGAQQRDYLNLNRSYDKSFGQFGGGMYE